ncbi:aluminum-activated malate transporter 8-like [Cornus florida]|uniref:aluminum-activated malate transporter 8-like n=1 Tax=Cornus florida TaxID=4283 RepID=UPI0028A0DE6D|nr:aluminum-activated malate transporter 8-like [Cornus florida]
MVIYIAVAIVGGGDGGGGGGDGGFLMKMGSFEINIPSNISKAEVVPERGNKFGKAGVFSFKGWIWSVWEFCKEDRNRVIFSLKVGLAVLLVSLLILLEAPYQIFGVNIIWSILTVAIMFEYTVGATFNRGFNRALGSLLAGILAIAIAQLALISGRVAEPIVIGISIFLIGGGDGGGGGGDGGFLMKVRVETQSKSFWVFFGNRG